MSEKEKEVYEIGYLIIPIVSEEEVLTEVANIKAILEKQGASFLSGDEPKLVNLAYSVSKMFGAEKQIFEKAYFAWIKFDVEVDKLLKVKTELDKYKNILRYLLVKTIKKDILVGDNKKPPFVKKNTGIVDEEKAKEIEPVKIVPKLTEGESEDKDSSLIKIVEKEEITEKEKKEKEDLDETIDNLIIK